MLWTASKTRPDASRFTLRACSTHHHDQRISFFEANNFIWQSNLPMVDRLSLVFLSLLPHYAITDIGFPPVDENETYF
jgi:hypothetical protein